MRWAGHVARMKEKGDVYRIFVGKPEGKRPLGKRCKYQNIQNIPQLWMGDEETRTAILTFSTKGPIMLCNLGAEGHVCDRHTNVSNYARYFLVKHNTN